MGKQNAGRVSSVFPEADFYCPPADVIEMESARLGQGHFNLIHHHSIYEADIYIATGSEFERWAFRNRRPLVADKTPVWLAPPEYVIVHKLEFFREGGSEKHLRDIRGMLAVTEVDRAMLQKEIAARALEDAWRAVEKQN